VNDVRGHVPAPAASRGHWRPGWRANPSQGCPGWIPCPRRDGRCRVRRIAWPVATPGASSMARGDDLEPGQVVANRLGLHLPFEVGHGAGSEQEAVRRSRSSSGLTLRRSSTSRANTCHWRRPRST